ncbi:hypothetical protein [Pseudofrankia sp. DC12]|uniref:hypothetical protein n=1 Tax=Pseudofrankia sp. DC12 TaxID=683315 RepID=UPI0005F816A0|nr:hypothetical protein [Pseudofrankia sp. DC12]
MTAGATPTDETPPAAGTVEPGGGRPDPSPTAAVSADLPASRDAIAAGEVPAPSFGDAPAGAPPGEHPWPVPEGQTAALPPPATVAWAVPESVPAALPPAAPATPGQPWSVPAPGLGQTAVPGRPVGTEAPDRGGAPARCPWLVGLAVGVVLVLVAAAVVLGVSLRADGGSSGDVSAALPSPARTTTPAPPSPSPTRAYAPVPTGGPGPAYSGAMLSLDGIQPEHVSVSRDGVLYVSGYSFNRSTVYRIDPDGSVTPIVGDEKRRGLRRGRRERAGAPDRPRQHHHHRRQVHRVSTCHRARPVASVHAEQSDERVSYERLRARRRGGDRSRSARAR